MNRAAISTGILISVLLLIPWPAAAAPGCGEGDTSKTTICHLPPGNPANAQTLCVGNAAVAAHLDNHPGDSVGPCGPASCGNGACEPELGEDCVTCGEDCSEGIVCCQEAQGICSSAACCAACAGECVTDAGVSCQENGVCDDDGLD